MALTAVLESTTPILSIRLSPTFHQSWSLYLHPQIPCPPTHRSRRHHTPTSPKLIHFLHHVIDATPRARIRPRLLQRQQTQLERFASDLQLVVTTTTADASQSTRRAPSKTKIPTIPQSHPALLKRRRHRQTVIQASISSTSHPRTAPSYSAMWHRVGVRKHEQGGRLKPRIKGRG